MKAKVNTTGETVNILEYHIHSHGVSFCCQKSDGSTIWYRSGELASMKGPDDSINWEQRRFELVKAALPAIIPLVNGKSMEEILSFSAEASLKYADEVIAKLKEE